MNNISNNLLVFWETNKGHLAFLIIAGFVLYGFELTTFNLSIDEEIAIRHSEANKTWIAQGRWGMYLINSILLPTPIIPFIPLATGIVFLSLSFLVISHLLNLKDQVAWYVAAPIFIGCPTLFYIYHFSTFNFGVGVGFFLAALGVLLFTSGSVRWLMTSIFLMAIAIGIYQSFLLLMVALFLCWIIANSLKDSEFQARDIVSQTLKFILCLALSVGLYFVLKEFFLWSYEVPENQYTSSYFNLQKSLSEWRLTLFNTYQAMYTHMLGNKMVFGIGVPALAYIAICSVLVIFVHQLWFSTRPWSARLLVIFALPLLICSPFVLNLANLGNMPTRALVTIPLVLAFLIYISISLSNGPVRWLLIVLAGFTTFQFAAANSNLAMRDHLALNADRMLAMRVQARVDSLMTNEKGPVPLEVVGQPKMITLDNLNIRQTVGSSFFTHAGGNIYRVIFFLRTLGIDSYRAATPDERRSLIENAKSMDNWPSKDSVKLIDGVVVVKFADYSYSQTQFLCNLSSGQISGCN